MPDGPRDTRSGHAVWQFSERGLMLMTGVSSTPQLTKFLIGHWHEITVPVGNRTNKFCCCPTAHATDVPGTAMPLLHLGRNQSDGNPYGCDRQATNNRD